MIEESNAIQRLRLIARPMMFDTGVRDYPVAVAGTAFIVGLRRHMFVLTAKHVLRDCAAQRVMIVPCEGAQQTISITAALRVEMPESDDPDNSDLAIMPFTRTGLRRRVRASARILDLNRGGISDWFKDRFGSTFFMFGYPKALNGVNYSRAEVETNQVFLSGNYVGSSSASECHEVRFANPLGITDFDGLSGSPVFSARNTIGPLTRAPWFCGIALRGGSAEGRVHFLSAEVILAAIDTAAERLDILAKTK